LGSYFWEKSDAENISFFLKESGSSAGGDVRIWNASIAAPPMVSRMINRANPNGQVSRLLIMISCIMFLASCAGVSTNYRPKWIENPGQICIERPEEIGMVNIVGVNVIIRDFQTIRLLGGQAACAYVEPGDFFVYGHSYDPSDPNNPNPQAWKSETLRFDVKGGGRADLVVCKGGWESRSHWVLKYADQKGCDKCQVEVVIEEMKKQEKEK
jgi:hypothetical protein